MMLRSLFLTAGLLFAFPVAAASVSSASALTIRSIPVSAASIPNGAQRVKLLDLNVRASCTADVPLHSMTLFHEGLGATRDLLRVYAGSGSKRLTRGFAIASGDGRVTLNFRSLMIRACTERTITIFTDFAADAATGGEHRLTLRNGHDVDIGAAGIVTLESSSSGLSVRTTPTSQGTITVTYLPLLNTVTYGEGRTILRLRFHVSGERNQEVTAITFTNDGSARDNDLRNLVLVTSKGIEVSDTAAQMEGDHVRLSITDPLFLKRNEDIALQLRADVRASRRRTIRFVIEEPSDIENRDAARSR